MTEIARTFEKAVTPASNPLAARQPQRSSCLKLLALAWRALVRLGDRFSKTCRRVRAYNDLARLDPPTLHAIGRNHELLDRVLNGQRPMGHQNRPEGRI